MSYQNILGIAFDDDLEDVGDPYEYDEVIDPDPEVDEDYIDDLLDEDEEDGPLY